jgi:SAM-dependent methyltransferase
MNDKNTIPEFFDRASISYNDLFFSEEEKPTAYPLGSLRTKATIGAMSEHLKGLEGKHLVDLGCGTGHLVGAALQNGMRVTGIDFSSGMLEKAINRTLKMVAEGSEVNYQQADIFNAGLKSGLADAVGALGLIEYLSDSDIERFFQEACRLLRPGGVLVLETRNRLFNAASANVYTLDEIHNGKITSLVEELNGAISDTTSIRPFLREYVKNLERLLPELSAALDADEADPVTALDIEGNQSTTENAELTLERSQQTPHQLSAWASSAGLQTLSISGLHPHPLPPRMESAAPRTYNILARALESFHGHPVSMIWSSSMLAVFTKPL